MIGIPEVGQASLFHRRLYQCPLVQRDDRQAGSPKMLTHRVYYAEPQW
jgi:hypothetical protein